MVPQPRNNITPLDPSKLEPSRAGVVRFDECLCPKQLSLHEDVIGDW